MSATVFLLLVIGLVIYGLQRNHAARLRIGSRLAGSTGVADRDGDRVGTELQALAQRQDAPSSPGQAAPREARVPAPRGSLCGPATL